MSIPEISLARDTAGSWDITLVHAEGDALTYSGAETLSAKLWAGDDRLVIATLTPTWKTPPDLITLAITTATTATLDAGRYLIRVYVGSSPTHAAEAILRLQMSPGTATVGASYCSAEDLRNACNQIEDAQSPTVDQTGYAEQRAEAREWFEMLLHKAYANAPPDFPSDQIYKYGNPFFVGQAGGRDSVLQGYLDDDMLLVTREIKRCNAAYALGLIFRGKWTGAGWNPNSGNDAFKTLAEYWEGRAHDLAKGIVAEIDTGGDGEGDIRIDLGRVKARKV